MTLLLREEKENLLLEYHLLHESIWEREYKTWVVNAILIIGSLLVAFIPEVPQFPTPIISIILLLAALILQSTSERITKINYKRIQEITEQLRIQEIKKTYESKIQNKWWYISRKNISYILITALIMIYIYLILTNL